MAQGTVKDYDPQERQGTVWLDDRTEVLVDATSVEGAGILTLRLGQRVVLDVAEEEGRKMARNLRIITFS
jgi:cold shock CspA family protein